MAAVSDCFSASEIAAASSALSWPFCTAAVTAAAAVCTLSSASLGSIRLLWIWLALVRTVSAVLTRDSLALDTILFMVLTMVSIPPMTCSAPVRSFAELALSSPTIWASPASSCCAPPLS